MVLRWKKSRTAAAAEEAEDFPETEEYAVPMASDGSSDPGPDAIPNDENTPPR